MRRILLAAALVAAPLAGHAQDSSDGGSNPIEEGAELFLRGLLDEMRPPLEELAGIGAKHLLTLQAVLDEMGPAFAEVFEQIDSITYYQAPEILPNGDILFRRNADAPPWEPPAPAEEGPDAPSARPEPTPREAPESESEPESEPGTDFRANPGLGLEL